MNLGTHILRLPCLKAIRITIAHRTMETTNTFAASHPLDTFGHYVKSSNANDKSKATKQQVQLTGEITRKFVAIQQHIEKMHECCLVRVGLVTRLEQ